MISRPSFEFIFIKGVSLFSLTPSSAPEGASVGVELRGSAFRQESMLCRFGDQQAVVASVSSSTLLRCVSNVKFVGIVPVAVTANGVEFSNALDFETQRLPRIESVNPCRGRMSGSILTISGSNFASSDSLVVRFGAATMQQASWLSSSAISCTIPAAMPVLNLTVSVSNNGVHFGPSLAHFAPAVSSEEITIEPLAGSAHGGTIVRVFFGKHLSTALEDGFTCRFGEITSHTARIEGSTGVCIAPPHAVGHVAVEVVAQSTAHRFAVASFTYRAVLALESVLPAVVPAGGATSVTIVGGEFRLGSAYACTTAGGAGDAAPVAHLAAVVSSSLLRCSMAPLSAASYSLEVMQDTEGLSASALYLSSTERPLVAGISPLVLFGAAAQTVTVVGARFDFGGDARCALGGEPLGRALVLNASALECLASPAAPGDYALRLTFGNSAALCATPAACAVTRVHALLRRVTPSAARAGAGARLTVHGQGLDALFPLVTSELRADFAGGLACVFGTPGVGAVFSSPAEAGVPGALTCLVPVDAVGTLPLSIRLEGTAVPAARGISVLLLEGSAPALLSLHPSLGPASGPSTTVTVAGTALPERARCRFGGAAAPARRIAPGAVVCVLAAALPGAVELSLENDGPAAGTPVLGALRFDFHAPWEALAVAPAWAPAGVPVALTVFGENFAGAAADAGAACRVGGTQLAATVLSASAVRCDAPGLAPGNHSVSVSSNGEAFVAAAEPLRVFTSSAPQLQPSVASAAGGTLVTVTSPHFAAARAPAVMFDQSAVVCAAGAVPDSAVCAAPRHAPGLVLVQVLADPGDKAGGALGALAARERRDACVALGTPQRGRRGAAALPSAGAARARGRRPVNRRGGRRRARARQRGRVRIRGRAPVRLWQRAAR